jgi:hypothetical protein
MWCLHEDFFVNRYHIFFNFSLLNLIFFYLLKNDKIKKKFHIFDSFSLGKNPWSPLINTFSFIAFCLHYLTFLPPLNNFYRTDVYWRNLISYLLPWLCWKFGTHIFNLAVLLWHLQRFGLASSHSYILEKPPKAYKYLYFLSSLLNLIFFFLSMFVASYLMSRH